MLLHPFAILYPSYQLLPYTDFHALLWVCFPWFEICLIWDCTGQRSIISFLSLSSPYIVYEYYNVLSAVYEHSRSFCKVKCRTLLIFPHRHLVIRISIRAHLFYMFFSETKRGLHLFAVSVFRTSTSSGIVAASQELLHSLFVFSLITSLII